MTNKNQGLFPTKEYVRIRFTGYKCGICKNKDVQGKVQTIKLWRCIDSRRGELFCIKCIQNIIFSNVKDVSISGIDQSGMLRFKGDCAGHFLGAFFPAIQFEDGSYFVPGGKLPDKEFRHWLKLKTFAEEKRVSISSSDDSTPQLGLS